MNHSRILIAEDEMIARENLSHVLTRKGAEVVAVENGRKAMQALAGGEFDLVISDLRMPDMDGMQLLEHVKGTAPDTEVIIITGYASIETAVEAMRKGAYQYLAKPIRLDEVCVMAEKALEKRRLRQEVDSLRRQLKASDAPVIIGHSPAIRALKENIEQVAPVDCTVLILGETGTGKELVARSLHAGSQRSANRFLAVNCASFTEELLANELFGHEKAAFTGAQTIKKGLIESADKGTFFLDEVGDMPLSMQANLLRVLETRTLLRVGGTTDIPVDVRIVAATNRDLKLMVEEGTFRQDLYYRLNVITLRVPPLAERKEDVVLLASFFANRFASAFGKNITEIDDEALRILMHYPFPGNVRELENLMERAVVLCNGDTIGVAHLPHDMRDEQHLTRPCAGAAFEFDGIVTLDENERRYLVWVLEQTQGNKTRAAELLGLNRGSLWRKLKRFGLDE
ncbi:sigma-54 dependent transcriptional regulator [Desulfovibrio mangrovi]|uniref:sigma-54-dependent transcriptional regulator n=1 Tax=Desulfovibrio mangrovi TaxID=2976983 RepID=UPI00224517B2|nr:sigma-54 dependent transcriptional regulator [Desulfovibrio mangrovi]UZP67892.1 sigma-54 dependent transcriptional regulator [Desulfovibrio mangrovi]